MEAKARFKYISTSPMKMRLVIDLVRGKAVDEALVILQYSKKHSARTAEKVLRSAVSNFMNKEQEGRIEPHDLYIKTAFVDGGATAKRVLPAPMGRAFRVRKRSNHITIIVAKKESN